MDISLVPDKIIKFTFTRMHLLDIWLSRTGSTNSEKTLQVLSELTSVLSHEERDIQNLENRVSYVCKKLGEYWKQCSRSKSKLMAKHQEWLKVVEICNLALIESPKDDTVPQLSENETLSTNSRKRFLKTFEDCSQRSKRRRLQELSEVDESAIKYLRDQPNQPSLKLIPMIFFHLLLKQS